MCGTSAGLSSSSTSRKWRTDRAIRSDAQTSTTWNRYSKRDSLHFEEHPGGRAAPRGGKLRWVSHGRPWFDLYRGRKRSSPKGGSPKGTPRKTHTPSASSSRRV